MTATNQQITTSGRVAVAAVFTITKESIWLLSVQYIMIEKRLVLWGQFSQHLDLLSGQLKVRYSWCTTNDFRTLAWLRRQKSLSLCQKRCMGLFPKSNLPLIQLTQLYQSIQMHLCMSVGTQCSNVWEFFTMPRLTNSPQALSLLEIWVQHIFVVWWSQNAFQVHHPILMLKDRK